MRNVNSKQVIDWKHRRGEPRLGMEIDALLSDLAKTWSERESNAPYMMEFIPVRVVTAIEVFVREIVRELVDHGDPYFSNAVAIVKNAKIDLFFAKNLDGQKLSVGDFIAHSISLNTFETTMGILQKLIPDFSNKIRTAHPRWTEEKDQWPLPPIIADYDGMASALKHLFEIRHVLAHELSRTPTHEETDVATFISAAQSLVRACDWVIVDCLHRSTPKTQTQMNIDAGEEMAEHAKELDRILSSVKGLNGLDVCKVNHSQTLWEEFANHEAEMAASLVEGGSMYPMVWASAKSQLIEGRIVQLDNFIQHWLD